MPNRSTHWSRSTWRPGAQRCSPAATTSTHRRASAPTAAGWPGWPGTTRTCPGTARELWVAELGADGALGAPSVVAGGPDESIFQPEWSPDGVLHFVSDRSGWWNLYRQRDGDGRSRSRRWRPSSACRSGSSACRPTPSLGRRPHRLHRTASDGVGRLALLDDRDGDARADRARRTPTFARRCASAGNALVLRRRLADQRRARSSGSTSTAASSEVLRSSSTLRSTPATSRSPQRDRVPDRAAA